MAVRAVAGAEVIVGQAKLQADVRARVGKLRRPETGFRIVADLLEQHVASQFETQGAAGGTKWKGLSARTLVARAKRWGYYRRAGGGTAPLVWSGKLKRTFRKGRVHHIRRVTSRELRWGSSYRVADYQSVRRPIIAFRSEAQRLGIMHQPLVKYMRGESRSSVMSRARSKML